MSSRSEFVSYLEQYEAALAYPDVNVSVISGHHAAKILRNGLAVSGFCALEDFLKSRVQELWDEICSNNTDFSDLPEKVRALITFKLFTVLNSRASFEYGKRDYQGKISFAQTHAEFIASTKTAGSFTVSKYAFGFENSNLRESQISELLSAFQVQSGWQVMTDVCQKLGTSVMALNNAYSNAMEARHKAAHEASSDSPVTELENFRRVGAAIAFAFDVVLTECVARLLEKNTYYMGGGKLETRDFDFYYILPLENHWKIFLSSSPSRAKARCKTKEEAWSKVSSLSLGRRLITVEVDSTQRIVDWRKG